MTSEQPFVTVQKNDGVARIVLNRPERRNAFNQEMRQQFISCFEEIRSDTSVGAVITTGAGDVAYSSGADLSDFLHKEERGGRAATSRLDMYEVVRTFPKVTIAAVNGYCLGGAISLVLCHDVVIASKEKARFRLPEVSLGAPAGTIAPFLFRAIPQKWAFDLLLTGEVWDAETAQRAGLVTRIVPHDQLQEAAEQLGKSMAQFDRLTLEYCKRAAWAVQDQATHLQAVTVGKLLSDEHGKTNPRAGKGVREFLEKSQANPGH